ncbi:hypothetical protein K1719_026981 [Acacia pycnantha]|nr:hypothetical protein K1719_026981 [Acacia pycnantha]
MTVQVSVSSFSLAPHLESVPILLILICFFLPLSFARQSSHVPPKCIFSYFFLFSGRCCNRNSLGFWIQVHSLLQLCSDVDPFGIPFL